MATFLYKDFLTIASVAAERRIGNMDVKRAKVATDGEKRASITIPKKRRIKTVNGHAVLRKVVKNQTLPAKGRRIPNSITCARSGFSPMQLARESYRAHLIVWWAEKIPGTNFWKGRAAISEGYGKLNPHRLEGPDGRFETEKRGPRLYRSGSQRMD
jgi:hypothetical protein